VSSALGFETIDAIVHTVLSHAGAGRVEEALAAAAPLRDALPRDRNAALALTHLLAQRAFAPPASLELAREVFDVHGLDDEVVAALGSALEGIHDIRFLNAAPPADPLFLQIAERLQQRAAAVREGAEAVNLLLGLSSAARLLGHRWDAAAEQAYRRRLELRPDRWTEHYDLGLFLKTRGRFAEGMEANERAALLGGGADDSVQWNLGICATGARAGERALRVWKAMGNRIELGRFGLPEGGYHPVKVRLAERPLAERGADHDEPGLEETIWVERLSPCHGIVRSALFEDLGVDYGDAVLFDGAPITHHTYGDQRVAVFPHLATLERGGYLIVPFAGTQSRAGEIEAIGERIPGGVVLYPHTERVSMMCATCWGNEAMDHAQHRPAEHRVVRGKVCAPPGLGAGEVRRLIDEAVAGAREVRVLAPELSRLVGDASRAEVEARRIRMLGER
jgi:hypothetical protein